jgi:hypothetical protein
VSITTIPTAATPVDTHGRRSSQPPRRPVDNEERPAPPSATLPHRGTRP